jgi:tyrosyl-tRNA synthetase
VSDADAEKYIKIFTGLSKEKIAQLIEQQRNEPHLRILQKTLAKEVTIMVHSAADVQAAEEASQMLFGQGTAETLAALDEETFMSVFEGVPQFELKRSVLEASIPLLDFLSVHTSIFPSKGEARRMVEGGGLSINKEKVTDQNANVNADYSGFE